MSPTEIYEILFSAYFRYSYAGEKCKLTYTGLLFRKVAYTTLKRVYVSDRQQHEAGLCLHLASFLLGLLFNSEYLYGQLAQLLHSYTTFRQGIRNEQKDRI
jgi:hypothetical protein